MPPFDDPSETTPLGGQAKISTPPNASIPVIEYASANSEVIHERIDPIVANLNARVLLGSWLASIVMTLIASIAPKLADAACSLCAVPMLSMLMAIELYLVVPFIQRRAIARDRIVVLRPVWRGHAMGAIWSAGFYAIGMLVFERGRHFPRSDRGFLIAITLWAVISPILMLPIAIKSIHRSERPQVDVD